MLAYFPAYVIHLKDRIDRLETINKLEYGLNIKLEIYDASNGSEWWENSAIPKKHPWVHDKISKGMVGCSFSHLALLKKAFETNEKGILLFEDDTQLVQPLNIITDYLNKIKEFTNDALHEERNWDILLLGANEYVSSKPITHNIEKVNRFWGAHALYIKRESIPEIISTFESYISKGIFLPADWLYNKTIEEKHFIVYGPSSPKMYLQQSPGFVSSITGKVRV
jgi:GR25 family glycosyltransferase involved in LPS biosynthesis